MRRFIGGKTDDLSDDAHREGRRRWRLTILGSIFSVLVFLSSQVSMLFRAGWSLASFRAYYAPDQLANFAMVVNGAHGNFSSVEPFTETGTMVDPHLYFTLLGFVAHLFAVSPAIVYNVAGIGLQVLFVAGLSFGFVLITRRWWSAYLGALPYFFGTLSSIIVERWWTPLQSHAVLWGTFGVMFALNSQSAALVIAGLLLTLLVVVAKRRFGATTTAATAVLIGAGLGLLANIDTYSFFAALFFASYGLSIYAMCLRERWWPAAISMALLVLLILVGGAFASELGRVTVFGLALVPAMPGLMLAIARWRYLVIAPVLALAAAASPQLIRFVVALHSGDPFLKFREAATVNLGVPWRSGLLCAAPLLIPLILILVGGIHRKNALWIAYSAGSMVAWFLIAKNDLWGANQEPYQLWIGGFALTAFTIIPVVIDVVLTYRPDWSPSP